MDKCCTYTVNSCNLFAYTRLKCCLLVENSRHGIRKQHKQGKSNHDYASGYQAEAMRPQRNSCARCMLTQLFERVSPLQAIECSGLVAHLPGCAHTIMQ
jgi:hypothetical protein